MNGERAPDVKCPLTDNAVFMDAGVLAAQSRAELYCPECGRLHIWDPGRNRLTDLNDPTAQISN